jgi:hypothetical protein
MKQFKYGMVTFNVVAGLFLLAAGQLVIAFLPFVAAYAWTKYEV